MPALEAKGWDRHSNIPFESATPVTATVVDDAANARNQISLGHSIRDGIAFSVMSGAGETYLSAYALFLKATSEQIALLASVPPLIGSGMQLVSAWLGGRGTPRKSLIVAGACAQGMTWFPLVLLPLLWPGYAIPILIACMVLYNACSNLIQPHGAV